LVDFWQNIFPSWLGKNYTWFYLANPYGLAGGWVVKESKADKVIGSTAVFPREVFVNGKCLLAGIRGDFGVDPNYRSLGAALQLKKAEVGACSEKQFDFLYGYRNKKSEPVQRRAGFVVVGSTCRMVEVLKSGD